MNNESPNRSNQSARSIAHKRLRPSGGYRNTCSFQTATIIYDATYWFCAGQQFWGCSAYPECKGILNV